MTIIYKVQVERANVEFGYKCREMLIGASSAIQACEAAERLAAQDVAGDDWPAIVHEFFAYRAVETTGAYFVNLNLEATHGAPHSTHLWQMNIEEE
jgi:hypothetical protein